MAITTSDISGWWDFDEGSGTSIGDSSDSGIDGTTSNTPTWVSDGPTNLQNGLDFVAASLQFVDFNNDFNNSSGGSAAVWVRPDNVATTSVIFGDGNAGGGGDFDILTVSNTIQGRTRFGGGDKTVSNAASNDTLYFVVYNWSDPDLELFVNGSSVDTDSTGTGGITGGTDHLHAATRTNEASLFFDGTIYQAILFNRVLTSGEVTELYNSGNGKTYNQYFGLTGNASSYFLVM